MTLYSNRDGYYDKTGHWQRTKFCFVSCGDRCTCSPPFGKYYNEAFNESKRNKEPKMIYGKLPIYCGQFEFDLPEVMYWLYLPVTMDNVEDIRVFPPLKCTIPLIKKAIRHAFDCTGHYYNYTYLSARKGWATPGNPLNRPGWHCDGFGTNDLNYVWWVGPGTRFAIQSFYGVVSDHNRSLKQFDEQVREESIQTYPDRGLYQIDPSVVHSTPLIPEPGCWRQYVKVSLSDERYNLENNSRNWLFDYDWPMHSRTEVRNDPHKAQRDYG